MNFVTYGASYDFTARPCPKCGGPSSVAENRRLGQCVSCCGAPRPSAVRVSFAGVECVPYLASASIVRVEIPCASCGAPCGTKPAGSRVRATCDDVCLGMYLDRQPDGHFANGKSGPLCGRRYLCDEEHPAGDLRLCDVHERLAAREIAWRKREGHDPFAGLPARGEP